MAQFPEEQAHSGEFKRQEDAFRDWVKRDGSTPYGVGETVNFDHIKRQYYMTHEQINPTRIVPLGPALDLDAPHGREKSPRGA